MSPGRWLPELEIHEQGPQWTRKAAQHHSLSSSDPFAPGQLLLSPQTARAASCPHSRVTAIPPISLSGENRSHKNPSQPAPPPSPHQPASAPASSAFQTPLGDLPPSPCYFSRICLAPTHCTLSLLAVRLPQRHGSSGKTEPLVYCRTPRTWARARDAGGPTKCLVREHGRLPGSSR